MALGRRAKSDQIDGSPNEKSTSPKETYLDEGCSLSGVLRFAQNVRIEGRVEGEVLAEKSVVIGKSAEIDASIEADTLEVYGTVLGDIRVARRTTLHKTSHVEGEIHTTGIVVEEGARFKGRILIGSESDEPRDRPAPTSNANPPATSSGTPTAV